MLSHMNYNCITSASNQSVRPRVKKEWGCQDMGNWSSLMDIQSWPHSFQIGHILLCSRDQSAQIFGNQRSWLQWLMRNLTGEFVHLL